MAGDTLVCDQHVSSETLSAWRDSLLSPAEMERIRTHAAGCAACQARLADFESVARALLAQREIEPDGRLLANLRVRAAQAPRRGRLHLPNRRVWRGLGALGSVAAVLLIAIYLLAAGPGHFFNLLGGGTPTARSTAAPTTTVTATPTLSQVVSVTRAWGPHAASASFTTRVDATHIFVAQSITADGRTLLGDEITTSGASVGESMPAQAGMYDPATQRFTPIGVSGTSLYPPYCCDTDGRFLIAEDSAAPGATCGVCNERIWSYDLTTPNTLWKVAQGITYGGLLGANLSHGILLLSTQGNGIQEVNLATHVITPLRGVSSDPSQSVVSAFDWPYVVYGSYVGTGTNLRLRNLATGQDMPLPAIDALYASTNDSGSILISGDTLFAAVAAVDPNTGMALYTTLYEMDAITSPNARPQAIAVFKGDLSSNPDGGARLPIGVNSRLVVFQGAAWDRAERRFVNIGAAFYGLAGNYLIATTTSLGIRPLNTTPPTVTIYDTSTLPVTSG